MLFRLVRSADGIAAVRLRTTGASNPHTSGLEAAPFVIVFTVAGLKNSIPHRPEVPGAQGAVFLHGIGIALGKAGERLKEERQMRPPKTIRRASLRLTQ